jgi:PAS domain S-box-containing protein
MERSTGFPGAALIGKRNEEVMPEAAASMWNEALDDVLRTGRQRVVECTLPTPGGPRRFRSVLTQLPGERVCSVSRDVTDELEAKRAHEAAAYLAAAGRLLERFDPATSLQAIVDLAVPVLADWCFVYVFAEDGRALLSAIANLDPAKIAVARARAAQVDVVSGDTALARVLAGGPPELMSVDDQVLTRAAVDPSHLAHLKRQGYKSAVVAPLPGRDRVVGVVNFVMADSGRSYDERDLDLLVELARRTGIALDNARLLEAEQRARRHAESARDRTRRLQHLTERLSGANEQSDVVSIMVSAGRDALGAVTGLAWQLRDEVTLELTAIEQDGKAAPLLDTYRFIPMTAPLPACDVVRTGKPLIFENLQAIDAAYPGAVPPNSPYAAWAVVPMMSGGRALGVVNFSFTQARDFSADDRELLMAMIGQASLALDRSMLLASERRAREEAETARQHERQLHVLAARLSNALTPPQVAQIACEEAVTGMGAASGALAVRDNDEVVILGNVGPCDAETIATVARVSLDAALPLAEAMRTDSLVWCATTKELASRYAHLEFIWRNEGIQSWGAAPFAFEGRNLGAIALSYSDERVLEPADLEFLSAVGQLTAQAFERARLYEAVRAGEEQLRRALTAARAGTWVLDLKTMMSTRDSAYRELVGLGQNPLKADFEMIHPDDRVIARAALARALQEGEPYEPEVRVLRSDGTYMWVHAHARLTYGSDGKPSTLAGVVVDIDEAKRASLRAEEERRIRETLHRLGSSFGSELDHDRLVKLITSEVAKLVGAQLGTFLENAPPIAHEHPSFRSYLAVPVMARSGEFFGVLTFGHREPGKFTSEHERLATSIAGQAAVALENARLYRTVREQKEQLEVAVERATVADRRKNEFLAMLGHELRNPLAPIVNALAVMDLRSRGDQAERDVIRRQVAHLTRLVDDLLDVSRITRGKVQLSVQPLEIRAVLEKAVETASPLLEQRLQRIVIDVPKSGLRVNADATRLAQVFQNLLTNASKYSDERAQIALIARAREASVDVTVRDGGIGIAAELLPHIFDSFVQGEQALDRAQGGLGIGLTIAKSLCELHAGAMAVESEGPGKGSTFTVTLPRIPDEPQRVEVRTAKPVGAMHERQRVLIVDDNVDAAKTLRALLHELGHEPALAHDGAVALELAKSFQPNIALLDIGLPAMDGYELASRLRELLGDRTPRLIAITGYGQDSDRARARQAGFDRHLVKPVTLDALVSLLEADGSKDVDKPSEA